MNIMYNGMSSVFGGFGGYPNQIDGQNFCDGTPNPDGLESQRQETNELQPEQTIDSPATIQNNRPKPIRFSRAQLGQDKEQQPNNFASNPAQFQQNQVVDPFLKSQQFQGDRDESGPTANKNEPEESTSRSIKSYQSRSQLSQQSSQQLRKPKKELILFQRRS